MDSRAVDANTRYLGIPTILLMENAGRKIADECSSFKNIALFCGRGGNGGDGLAAARILHAQGKKVKVYALSGKRSKECQENFDVLSSLDANLSEVSDSSECEKIKNEVLSCDVVVDALLGVGVTGDVREPVKSIIKIINSFSCPKISVDVASGDENLKVEADTILSLHSKKTPGSKVVDIGIPKEAETLCGPGDVLCAIPPRKPSAHKGDYGTVLILGGSKAFIGAPALAAQAGLRAGADLSFIATPVYVCERMSYDPNVIVRPLGSKNHFSEDDVDLVLALKFDCLVVGNGIGRHSDTKIAVRKLFKKVDAPMVVDADALRLVEKKHLKANMVLTPHRNEFTSLFGEYDEGDRVSAVSSFSRKYGPNIVLKGAVDVISNGRQTKRNRSGNPAMTVGGTGDVLAGVIGGLIAQNNDLFASACAGAFITGLAGDIAFERFGVSLTATDVIDSIASAIQFSTKYF